MRKIVKRSLSCKGLHVKRAISYMSNGDYHVGGRLYTYLSTALGKSPQSYPQALNHLLNDYMNYLHCKGY